MLLHRTVTYMSSVAGFVVWMIRVDVGCQLGCEMLVVC